MTLSTYTTPQEIRAVLGVSSTELTDATLALPMYGTLATLGLEDIHVNLPDDFSTVSALPSKTAQQQRFVDLVKLYVPYKVSKELLVSLPMFSVKQLSDGRAEFQRQADIFDDLKDGVDAALSSLRYRLAATYQALYPANSTTTATRLFTQTLATGVAVDPVTGV